MGINPVIEVLKSNKNIENKNEETIKIDKKSEELLQENIALKHKISVLEEQLNYFEIFKIVFGLVLIALIFVFIKKKNHLLNYSF